MGVVAGKSRSEAIPGLGHLSARRLAVWVSLALVCLAAFAALMLMQGIERQIRDVSDTYAVRDAARQLNNTLSEAEASQRGYLLTRDPQFLAPYLDAAWSIENRVNDLLARTADDPAQTRRIQSMLGDISSKVAEMARTVELVAAERRAEAQTLTETGMGARLMAEVRDTLEAFIAEENIKLEARNQAIDQTRQGLVGALIAALAGAVILAYALLSRTQRQVSALTQRHHGLVSQNEALELEVAERTQAIDEALSHAERERQRVEALLQDTNHRIGNSLATVSSLLALQSMRTRSVEVKQALDAARLRVHAIASAHRRLRLGDDLESASADDFLTAVLEDIESTQADSGRITVRGDIESIVVGARDATTLGILVGELVTNALKHAFPDGRRGTILVALFRGQEGGPILKVTDNGIGLPEGATNGDSGLGSVIVRQLSDQFGGCPLYEPAPGGGLVVTVALPQLEKTEPASPEMVEE